MKDRVHLLLDPADKERFRRMAAREGKSLSAWIRDLARERAAEALEEHKLDSVEELRAFFRDCDLHEQGREPDWDEHRQVIEHSIASGQGRS